jgi:hypothetical protein
MSQMTRGFSLRSQVTCCLQLFSSSVCLLIFLTYVPLARGQDCGHTTTDGISGRIGLLHLQVLNTRLGEILFR